MNATVAWASVSVEALIAVALLWTVYLFNVDGGPSKYECIGEVRRKHDLEVAAMV